ncbi:MAG: prefoldin subunit alpha [Candidatus Hodarchaeaceae archaeon]|nr:prefoldin subunit alpha [Candidatus Hodarchaeaceae archaeon]
MENLSLENRQRLQRILNEIGNYQATADLLRQQISFLAASLSELSMTAETIRTIKELKPETEILVPIGSDSFVTAKLALTDKVTVGLGADVAAEQGIDDAMRMLETRTVEIEQAMERARQELEKLNERIEALRPEAERILEKTKEKK